MTDRPDILNRLVRALEKDPELTFALLQRLLDSRTIASRWEEGIDGSWYRWRPDRTPVTSVVWDRDQDCWTVQLRVPNECEMTVRTVEEGKSLADRHLREAGCVLLGSDEELSGVESG